MSQRITIEIKDKIATCLTELPIVCGNADYVVDFAFDEEWEKHEVKTAIFVVNGQAIPQVFAGNVCPIPVIQNTLIAWVGVFAGTVNDGTLATSTPALVKCIPCITDGDNVPMAPPDDVYNQIIGLINAGMLVGPQGEKGEKGDKGDAGSVKFVPVSELPTENIEYDAIYLVPIEGSEENRFTEYVYVDGKWEPLGSIAIQVDHSEFVKFTDIADTDKAGVVKVNTKLDYGLELYEGTLRIKKPSEWNILHGRQNASMSPVTLATADLTVKQILINPLVEMSSDDQAKACAWLGALAKVIDSEGAYTTDKNGNISIEVIATNEARQYSLVKRSSKGVIYTGEPTENGHATTKKYVDDLIAELRAEIDALKA